MKKIFPFYKGKNIANNPLGYTSEKNAKLRMKMNDIVKDFESTLPENYWDDYLYLYELENPWREDYNAENKKEYRLSEAGGRFYNRFFLKGYVKNDRKYLKTFSDEMISLIKLVNQTEDEETYLVNMKKLLELGLYPHAWKDETDYNKRLKKFIKDNVEFKELEVEINIKKS